MTPLPEGVASYPRWDGPLKQGSLFATVAAQEVRRAIRGTWSLLSLGGGLAWGFASVVQLYQERNAGDTTFTKDAMLAMLHQLRWFALAVAATVGGPTLLEDARRGALELYLSRAVTALDYLAGKVVAVVGLTTFTMFAPAVAYYLASFVFFDKQPPGWNTILGGALLYSLMWALLVSGLALGLSSVGRNSIGTILILFGGFAGLDIIVGKLLSGLTGDEQWQVLSPFAALEQQSKWIFGAEATYEFPYYWGLLEWAVLLALGWSLLAWRRPRIRGEERVRA